MSLLTPIRRGASQTIALFTRAVLRVIVAALCALGPALAAPFTDANWSSIGVLPGANGLVYAAVVDGSGNLYIGGDFTIVGMCLPPTSPNGTGAVGARWVRG
jgi:hypothetical protein